LGRDKTNLRVEFYKLVEELSDMPWHDFDKWNKRLKIGPKIKCPHEQYKT